MAKARRAAKPGLLPRLAQWIIGQGRAIITHPHSLVCGGVLLIALWGLGAALQRAEAFKITRVELPEQPAFTLKFSPIGSNLWRVDVRGIADILKAQQPSLKDVRVIRHMPNTLRIEAVERRPVAAVQLDQWYPMDAAGFVLPDPSPVAPEGLLRITGLSSRTVKVGRDNADDRVLLVLRLRARLRRAPSSIAKSLVELNVADDRELRLVLRHGDEEVEVRCGSEGELETHLRRLHASLRALGSRAWSARYIDVRFPQPVVAPRIAKWQEE